MLVQPQLQHDFVKSWMGHFNDLELHNFFNLKDVIENSLKLDLKCSYKKNDDSPVANLPAC